VPRLIEPSTIGDVGTVAADGTETGTIASETIGGAPPSRHVGPLKVGASFGPRYHIIRLLGAGGMGAVYQAWDAELGVAVALKVIRGRKRRPSADLEKRFKNELLLARSVTHKNVVRIHDINEIDGQKFISMSYVQGDDLATLLRKEGKFPIERALRFARQIAAGLEAAHDAGVVHRDLKPANVMISGDDHALIMDFGISASADEAATGGIIGTLEYMAPEQGAGRTTDARADIYSFGLILHEMLVGPRAAASATPQERVDAMRRRAKDGVAPPRTVDGSIPEAVDALVARCLQPDPAARFQSTRELCAALSRLDDAGEVIPEPARVSKRLLAGALVVVLAMIGGTYFVGRRAAAPAIQRAPVGVVVADFENRTGDPVFDGSVEQALTIGLEGASFITAVSNRDTHRLAAQLGAAAVDEATATLIAVREGVKFVVAGAIEPDGSGYRVSARLIDPAVGRTIKTTSARARSKDQVLQAVGTLAADVRRDLGDTTPESARLAASETFTAASIVAVREYTLAQDLANNSRNDDAIVHYKKAIEADPNFGRAYSGWANSVFQLGRNDEASELWKRALSLMDRMTDRERYRTLGAYYLAVARNNDQAIESYTKLLERYPADRSAHNNLAIAYFNKLDFQKALAEGRRAIEIYKGSAKFRNNYLIYAMYAGDFATAEAGARDLVAEDPNFADAYFPLAISLLAKGDRAGARTAYEAMLKTGGEGASRAAMGLADLAIFEGRFADAETILKRAIVEDEREKNALGLATKYGALAEASLTLGKNAQATDAARKSLAAMRLESTALPAARVFMATGRIAEARALAAELAGELQVQPRAYAKIIEGELALQQDRVGEAVDLFGPTGRTLDLWLAHFNLGVAYVRAGHYAEAMAEFDTATKRKGEAAAVFLDDIPSYRYLATLPYWFGRAQEGVGMQSTAIDSFKEFLSRRPDALRDPLAADARRRIDAR
jgi:tetratricopeptide (TPR) repeat protein